jgi:hypothetical protein
MEHGRLEPIPGTPGDENTAVTIQTIKEILHAEGKDDLLLSRKKAESDTARTKGPLQQVAEAARLQRPPVPRPPMESTGAAGAMASRKEHLPDINDVTQIPLGKTKQGLLKRLFRSS